MNRIVIAAAVLLAAKAHTGKGKKHDPKATPTPAAAASATATPEAAASPAPSATATAAAAVATPVPDAPSPHKEFSFGDKVLVTKTNGVFEGGIVIGNTGSGLVLQEGGTQSTIPWANITKTEKKGFGGDTLAKKGDPVKATKTDGTFVVGKVDAAAEDSLRVMPFDAKEAVSVAWKDIAKLEPTDKPLRKITRWNWLNKILGICI